MAKDCFQVFSSSNTCPEQERKRFIKKLRAGVGSQKVIKITAANCLCRMVSVASPEVPREC